MKKLARFLKDSKREIAVSTFAGLIVAGIGTMVSALFKIQLSIIAAIVAAVIWLVCFFLYLRKRRIAPSQWRKRKNPEQLALVPAYPKLVRSLALVGIIALPLLAASMWGYDRYRQAVRTEKFIVLVAEFDGPDAQKYRVTETIINRLRQALEKYNYVLVETLGASISEQEGQIIAREEAKKRDADIFICMGPRRKLSLLALILRYSVSYNANRHFNQKYREKYRFFLYRSSRALPYNLSSLTKWYS